MEILKQVSYTFDDVLLRPGYAGFFREEVNVSTQLSRNISLEIPLVSSPMDTVTESRLAIVLARLGGIGIIHRNLRVEDQAKQVEMVKQEGLLVGAAIGSRPTTPSQTGYEPRAERLLEAGADVIVVDSAHGNSLAVTSTTRALRRRYGREIEIISGNIATVDGAKRLIDCDVDALRNGMGPGAICTTRRKTGMGVPQLQAIMEVSEVARQHGIPVIADGGMVDPGDLVKALAAGADTGMFGLFFGATEESCGKEVWLKKNEVPSRFRSILNGKEKYLFKNYRGMGSKAAIQQGIAVDSEEEFHGQTFDAEKFSSEGVDGLVPCSGPAEDQIHEMVLGLEGGLYNTGCQSIQELQQKAVAAVVTQASLHESHPHDIFVQNDH